MQTYTLAQDTKQHNVNALHDAFIAAGIVPVRVESNAQISIFLFQDAVQQNEIDAVVNAYTFSAPPAEVDVREAVQNFLDSVDDAINLAQLKDVLNNELMIVIREALRSRAAL